MDSMEYEADLAKNRAHLLWAIVRQAYSDYVKDLVVIQTSKNDETVIRARADAASIEEFIKGLWFEHKFKAKAFETASFKILRKIRRRH